MPPRHAVPGGGTRRGSPARKMPLGAAEGGEPTAEPHWEGALAGPPSGGCIACGVPSPQPSFGKEEGLGDANTCSSRYRAPQAMPQDQIRVSASQRSLFFCILFVGFFFPLHLMRSAGAPLLQLFCDTAQPSNVGNPDQRAAVTDSPAQAGQVPNLLFIRESSAE